jgi:transposase
MQRLKVTYSSIDEIEQFLKNKEDYRIATKLVCILLVAKGSSSHKAKELNLYSHNQICQFVKRYNKQGIEGLKDKPKPGRKPRLTPGQLAELKRIVLTESPEQHGFNSSTWTAPMLVKWVENNCNVTYSDDNIYLLLKNKLGLSHRKGKGFYPEANKDLRKNFSESLKKTPVGK